MPESKRTLRPESPPEALAKMARSLERKIARRQARLKVAIGGGPPKG